MNQGRKLFWGSFLIYACINLIENLIHYNIGRNNDRHSYYVKDVRAPTFHDWVKILVVMLTFATLQALLTTVWME